MVHKVLSLAQKLAMLPAAAMPQKIMSAAGHPMWRAPKFSKRQVCANPQAWCCRGFLHETHHHERKPRVRPCFGQVKLHSGIGIGWACAACFPVSVPWGGWRHLLCYRGRMQLPRQKVASDVVGKDSGLTSGDMLSLLLALLPEEHLFVDASECAEQRLAR